MFRVTGSVPQSGTVATADAEGALESPGVADAGGAVGVGVATAPGAAHPVTTIAASPRVASVARAVCRPAMVSAMCSPPSTNQCGDWWLVLSYPRPSFGAPDVARITSSGSRDTTGGTAE